MKFRSKKRKGFTLLELVLVIAIIGILLLVLIPNVTGVKQKSQIRAFEMTRQRLYEAALMFTIDYPNTPARWASHSAGHIANKDTEITPDNTHEAWYLYFDEYPQDPTREEGSTFTVEIEANGDIEIYPKEPAR